MGGAFGTKNLDDANVQFQQNISYNANQIFQNNPQALAQFNDDKGKFSSTKFEAYLKENYTDKFASFLMAKMKAVIKPDDINLIREAARLDQQFKSKPEKTLIAEYGKEAADTRRKYLNSVVQGKPDEITREDFHYSDRPEWRDLSAAEQSIVIKHHNKAVSDVEFSKYLASLSDAERKRFDNVLMEIGAKDCHAHLAADDKKGFKNSAEVVRPNLDTHDKQRAFADSIKDSFDKSWNNRYAQATIDGLKDAGFNYSVLSSLASSWNVRPPLGIPQAIKQDMAIVQRQFAAEQLRAIDDFIKGLIGEEDARELKPNEYDDEEGLKQEELKEDDESALTAHDLSMAAHEANELKRGIKGDFQKDPKFQEFFNDAKMHNLAEIYKSEVPKRTDDGAVNIGEGIGKKNFDVSKFSPMVQYALVKSYRDALKKYVGYTEESELK